jgi:hypothetical protein
MNWIHDLLAPIAVHMLFQVEATAATHHALAIASLACHLAVVLGALGPCL